MHIVNFVILQIMENLAIQNMQNLSDFKSNVKQLAELGVKFIDLTGGEPLLNQNIVEMTEFAKKLKMQTSITSNSLLYKKYAEGLAGKVNLLHFSLDSPDAEEHNKIRKVDCYNSVLESVELAKSLGRISGYFVYSY